MNLSDYRNEVSSIIGSENTTSGDQTLIDSWVNEGVTNVLLRLACKVLPGTVALTAGNRDYTIDTDILRILDMYLTSGTTDYPMERVTLRELDDYRIRGSASAPPLYWAVRGSNLLSVYPTPAAADTLNLYYVPRPATLSQNTDEPEEIPLEYHRLVTFYALSRTGDFDDDQSSQMGEHYRGLYEQGIREALAQLNAKAGRLAPARLRHHRRFISRDPSRSWAFG